MTLDYVLNAIEPVLRTTALGAWVRHSQWAWPVLESLHFIGMSVLIGTIVPVRWPHPCSSLKPDVEYTSTKRRRH